MPSGVVEAVADVVRVLGSVATGQGVCLHDEEVRHRRYEDLHLVLGAGDCVAFDLHSCGVLERRAASLGVERPEVRKQPRALALAPLLWRLQEVDVDG
jgi:hypothetical protein